MIEDVTPQPIPLMSNRAYLPAFSNPSEVTRVQPPIVNVSRANGVEPAPLILQLGYLPMLETGGIVQMPQQPKPNPANPSPVAFSQKMPQAAAGVNAGNVGAHPQMVRQANISAVNAAARPQMGLPRVEAPHPYLQMMTRGHLPMLETEGNAVIMPQPSEPKKPQSKPPTSKLNANAAVWGQNN